MKKSIYKIENKINHKIYIGQSVNPYQRFYQHCNDNKNSAIHNAIIKYGVENFELTILEENIENYNEREKYWIQYYNSLEKGYNCTEGGEEPPLNLGINNPNTTHDLKQVLLVKELLKNSDLSIEEIGEKTNYHKTAIRRINNGTIWKDPSEQYPLRKTFRHDISIEERWNLVVELLLTTDFTQKEIAEQAGIKRSAVTMINNGQNGSKWNKKGYKYPIRANKDYNNNL